MNQTQEIHLVHTIDTGHRILGHRGKCARLHGHMYKIELWMQGRVTPPGFVVDFGDVKDLLNEWDHRVLLWDEDPLTIHEGVLITGKDAYKQHEGVVRVPFNPTAENMADHLCQRIVAEFDNVSWVRMELWETPKSMARGQAAG